MGTRRPDAVTSHAAGQASGWSIAHAAQRVGLSASTLRSWEQRYGIAPSRHTVGGHRRYTVADIAALQQMTRLIGSGMPAGAAAAAVRQPKRRRPPGRTSASPGSDALAEQFVAAADGLDSVEIARVADQLCAARGIADAWTAVFAPYLIAHGRRWQRHGIGIECEHVAVSALQTVFDWHTWTRDVPRRAPVLLAATEAEKHTLPMHALAGELADRRIGTRVLGSLPAESVLAAAAALEPVAVLVWARSRRATDRRLLAQLVTEVPMVCAAGLGWTARSLPAEVVRVADFAGAVDLLDAWHRTATGRPARSRRL